MNKEGIATSAYFIEMWRWFTEKLTKWSKDHNEAWIKELKDSYVYAQEYDENDQPTGNWYSIIGYTNHGPNVTINIRKAKGEIIV